MKFANRPDTGARFRRGLPFRFLFALAFPLCGLVASQYERWSDYGGGSDQSKFVGHEQIDRSNVAQLEQVWMYPTGDESSYQFNPIIVDHVMYVLAKNDSLVAVDLRARQELWIHAGLSGISRRGISYWESEDRTDRRLLFMMRNTLQAIDAQTGKSILTFGEEGVVDLRVGLDRDPEAVHRAMSHTPGRVFENLIILGVATGEGYLAPPGHVRAYDVVTGALAWRFRTIPHPGEYGYETWPPEAYRYAGGANCWGEISLDEERGIAYVPLGSPTYDFYGADRIGENLFGNCLLALDARTGERLWHFQTVHHDLWDYDLVSAPQLVTVSHEGREIDAVAVATKHGFLFVLDRVTGEPLWPVEERQVPPSDVPGEVAWPTQPYPAAPPPYGRQIMTEDDVSSVLITPEERSAWVERVRKARKGLFVPPALEELVALPGAVGGVNWGNTAANPGAGMVYLLNQEFPSFYKLERRAPARYDPSRVAEDDAAAVDRGRAVYAKQCLVCHGADRAGNDIGPSLLGVGRQINQNHLRRTVHYGIGRMPAVAHIEEEQIRDLYSFLSAGGQGAGSAAATETPLPEGPVVQAGGAPIDDPPAARRTGMVGDPYPEGVDAPEDRYYTDYGLGHPYVVSPPWSTIQAYDLNTGTVRWKKPLGQDLHAAQAGALGTGVPRGSQRNGMVVTSTGLVFSTAKDGKVYAFDADDGETLWSGELPMGTEGLPAMFELDGRQYLVVVATTPLTWGLKSRESGIGSEYPRGRGGYVFFALPETANEAE